MNYKKILCFMLSASMFCGTAYAVCASELVPSTENSTEFYNAADFSSDTDTDPVSSESTSAVSMDSTESSGNTETDSSEEISEIPETEVTEEAATVTTTTKDQTVYSSSQAKSIVYRYLTQTAGFNSATACGIMANIQCESNYLSNVTSGSWLSSHGYTSASYTAAVDDGTYTNFVNDGAAYGLCQWMYYSIKQQLLDYANASGTSVGNIYMQLNFLVSTLNSMGYMQYLTGLPNDADGAYQASYNFCKYYERPGSMDYYGPARGKIAQELFSEFNPGSTDSDTSDSTNPSVISEDESYIPGTYKVTASSLSVRSGNSTDYSRLGYLSNGTKVDVLEVSNGWGKIAYDNGYGWICLSYCSLVSGSATTEAATTTTTETTTTTTTETTTTTTAAIADQEASAVSGSLYQVTASSLNVRSGPGTGYSVVATLYRDEEVTVLDTSGSWYKVSCDGTIGYASSKYLVPVSSSEMTTTETAKTTTTEKTTTTTTEQTTTTTEKPTTTTTEQTTTTTEKAAASETTDSLGTYRVTASSLTVRKGTGSNYASLGTLANGTEVTILEQTGNWGKISYNGQTGYIYMKYVEKVEEAPATTTTEKATTTTTEKPTTTTTETTTTTTEKPTTTTTEKPTTTTTEKPTTTTTETTTTTSTASQVSDGSIYAATTTLNVRSGPGTSYSVIGVLTTNQQVTVYEVSGTWAQILYNGQTAYTSTKYLQYIGEAATHVCTYDSGVIVKPATCIDTGLITYTCTECGETKDEILPVDKTNHTGNTVVENTSEATYEHTGYTGDTCCSDCGAVLEKGTSIPELVFAITKQPVSVVVAQEGYYATFTVEATGEGLTYAWYWKMPSDTSYKLSNVTTNTYHYAVTAARNGRQVYCVITDKNGDQLTTDVVTMSYK